MFCERCAPLTRTLAFDPAAEPRAELMSGSCMWADEIHRDWCIRCVWKTREVFHLRFQITLGEPVPAESEAYFHDLERQFPDWPLFRPERRSPEIAEQLRRTVRRNTRQACIDLERMGREYRRQQADGQTPHAGPGAASDPGGRENMIVRPRGIAMAKVAVGNAVNYISGHLDLTPAEFEAHYRPVIDAALSRGESFVIGDARGTDALAQSYLLGRTTAVVVYHMFAAPRNNVGFPTVGGFESDEARDARMTADSDQDIAWVRPGREKSGTQKNLNRRKQQRHVEPGAAPDPAA